MRSGVYFDDLDVGTAYGFAVADVEGWGGAADVARPLVAVPGRPGAIAVGPAQVAPRSLTLPGVVVGANIQEARDRVDALRVACAAGNSVRLRTEDEPDVEMVCVFARLTAPPTAARFASRQIPVTLELLAIDPYKVALATTTLPLVGATAVPVGSAPVAPVVTLTGAAGPVLTYRNAAGVTQAVVDLSAGAGAAGAVVIDAAAGTIHDGAGTSLLAFLTNASTFPLALDPAHATGYGTGAVAWPTLAIAGAATASVSYRKRYR